MWEEVFIVGLMVFVMYDWCFGVLVYDVVKYIFVLGWFVYKCCNEEFLVILCDGLLLGVVYDGYGICFDFLYEEKFWVYWYQEFLVQ